MKIRLALPAVLMLLVTAASAQDVNWTVVLQTTTVGPSGQNYLPIASETVNGQPLTLNGEGVIGPNIYYNSAQYGYIVAQVPPDQPWDPNNDWYAWTPDPYATPSQITRGTPQATGNLMVFTETDTFTYTKDLTFYQVWVQVWNGTLVRTLQLHERCGRWPCRNYVPIDLCTPANRCYISFTDLSDVMTLTGTFPIPVAP